MVVAGEGGAWAGVLFMRLWSLADGRLGYYGIWIQTGKCDRSMGGPLVHVGGIDTADIDQTARKFA